MEIYQNDSYLNLPIYFCINCKFYVTGDNETEIEKITDQLYKKEYWDERSSEDSIKSNYTNIDSQGKYRRWISQYKYFKSLLFNKKMLLEIGSGSGQTLFWFEKYGFNVFGVEPDKRNVEMINEKLKKGKCSVGTAENYDIDEKFDVVWMSHVFEHVIKPQKALEKIALNLDEQGLLFVEVPNCENEEILYESINNNPSTFHFSKYSLIKIAQNAGYEVIKTDYFRPPKINEGVINRIFQRYLRKLNYNPYPYYPKVESNKEKGTDIRIILKKNYNN